MERMLIWTGNDSNDAEYQTYSGDWLIGGDTHYIERLRAMRHRECGEVLLAVI